MPLLQKKTERADSEEGLGGGIVNFFGGRLGIDEGTGGDEKRY